MNPNNTQNPNNPNQYNPQTGNLVLNNSTTGIGNTPPIIPAGVGLGSVPTPSLPNTPQGTGASSLSGASAGYLAMPALNGVQNIGNQLSKANQVATQNANQGNIDYTTQFTNLLNQMQNRPGELESQYGIQKLSADALGAKANYDSVELAYRRQKEATMTDGALSADQKQARIGEIERKEASQKADIAIDYNLKAGLLSNAKELMQKQLALELEPLKMKADFYKDNRDRFDKILDKTEMRQYDYIQKKEERAYQAAQKAADRINDLKMQAIKDGVPYDQVKGIRSIEDYAKLTNQKPSDVIATEQAKDKIVNIDNIINAKTGKDLSVGASAITRKAGVGIPSLGIIPLVTSGARKDFLANTEALLSRMTLQSLIDAKANGATFGALSESELALLANSASTINQRAIKDKNGRVTGYDMSQKAFDNEMEKIKKYAIMDYEKRTGKPYTTEEDPAGLGINTAQLDPAGILK